MSRYTIFNQDDVTVVYGNDFILGDFFQVYDKKMENQTPEGEGLVLDVSARLGIETNHTGYSNNTPIGKMIEDYVKENTSTTIDIDELI